MRYIEIQRQAFDNLRLPLAIGSQRDHLWSLLQIHGNPSRSIVRHSLKRNASLIE
jgi:hypothetical protein